MVCCFLRNTGQNSASLKVGWIVLLWLLSATTAWSQDDDGFQAGLLANYRSVDNLVDPQNADGNARVAERVDEQINFVWNGSADARLQSGPFQANWSGFLESERSGEYQLAARLAGQLSLRLGDAEILHAERTVDDWVVSDSIQLVSDWHDFQASYRSDAKAHGRLQLYWRGPGFDWEPVPSRVFTHEAEEIAGQRFEHGRELHRAMRCSACHEVPGKQTPLTAPALLHVAENVRPSWIVRYLMEQPDSAESLTPGKRLMPHYGLTEEEARSVVAFLWSQSKPGSAPRYRFTKVSKKQRKPSTPNRGLDTLLALGCLACHQAGEEGRAEWHSGGDLSQVSSKRPDRFFDRWLADPSCVNASHRMPRFTLDEQQAGDLKSWLSREASKDDGFSPSTVEADIARGRKLVDQLQCRQCHEVSGVPHRNLLPLADEPGREEEPRSASCWEPSSSFGGWFALSDDQRSALQFYITSLRGLESRQQRGHRLMQEHNCTGCHQRGKQSGFAEQIPSLTRMRPKLASELPASVPPSLNSVGDKLQDHALRDAIAQPSPRRPYLAIRMPHFDLSPEDLDLLTSFLRESDRIPEGLPQASRSPATFQNALELRTVGGRLIGTNGLGCTSCHRVGSVEPANAPVHARGPDLSGMGQRIRRAWYDRWVRNPSRIVAGMEMPSVKIGVKGVLNADVDQQLDAVWQTLNLPGFEPPAPEPVRTLRATGQNLTDRTQLVTDVVHADEQIVIKPLLMGFANRQNLLLDLGTNRLRAWTIGDTARQRTEGKTWFWELAGVPLELSEATRSELALQRDGEWLEPEVRGQFVTEFDTILHQPGGIVVHHRLHFKVDGQSHIVQVQQRFSTAATSLQRRIELSNLPPGWRPIWRPSLTNEWVRSEQRWTKQQASITATGEGTESVEEGVAFAANLTLHYEYGGVIDRFPAEPLPLAPKLKPMSLQVVPGMRATRLPFADELMPTGLSWDAEGRLLITSLKGRLWRAVDSDHDGLEDRLTPISDELAAPFGVAGGKDHVDVINKFALLRLTDLDQDGKIDQYQTLASGWGHTTDYHDWAVGLPRDAQGAYYVAFSCQQDDRSQAAAKMRGTVVKLVPRTSTPNDPHQFDVQTISGGHRFPVGIARDHHGRVFVTDNQGNYNPFNELNHVQPGKRFGFLNKLEKRAGASYPLTPPAINIPHPWTRSVNGICFLQAPAGAESKSNFGPWNGHLIGCEYDTRRLVRMSLEQVGDVMQGAVYPFSYDVPPEGEPLLGPITCAVSPQGDLYIGCIRDSGWGGANNIGSVVRIQPADELPMGIAEVRIEPDGFTLIFTKSAEHLADANLYGVASYTRISTPAYGGDDVEGRVERIRKVESGDDDRSVRLYLDPLRKGFVYELRIKDEAMFPAEAYYTVNAIPDSTEK